MKKTYVFCSYENNNGGTNNLQVIRLLDEKYNCIRVFTSTVKKAKQYAEKWCKENNYLFSE